MLYRMLTNLDVTAVIHKCDISHFNQSLTARWKDPATRVQEVGRAKRKAELDYG